MIKRRYIVALAAVLLLLVAACTREVEVIKEVEVEKSKKVMEEMHNVQWSDLQNLLGISYPGNDMLKIYFMLTPKQRDMWRRGIYEYGVRSELDRKFVYYDSYYLGRYGRRDLYYEFYWYSRRRTSFDRLLNKYLQVIGERLNG